MTDNQVVKVQVARLEIDLPLDANNVTEKAASMRASGLIQPLTLWQQDLRVIDGFHRIAAAKLLGWTDIDAIVKDVSEEAFWDARIQSARQHATISDDRLAVWVSACWQSSEWPAKLDLSKWRPGVDDAAWGTRFRKRDTRELTPAHKQVAEALWLIRTDQVENGDKERLGAWFNDKATKWSMTMDDLEKIIYGLVSLPQPNDEFEKVVASKGLSFDERNDLARRSIMTGHSSPAHFGNNIYSARTAKEYLEERKPDETFNQYTSRKMDENIAKRRVVSAQTADQQINKHVSSIKDIVHQRFNDMRTMGASGAAVLINASATMMDLAEQVYPGARKGQLADAISVENMRLVAELEQAKAEIKLARKEVEKLRRELDNRRSVVGRAKSLATVFHSSEVERQ